MAPVGNGRSVLIIVENLPVPFDRRVWQEACGLRDSGWQVSVICPTGKGYWTKYEAIDDIHIYRHWLPPEGSGLLGYAREYVAALFFQFLNSVKVYRERGFNVLHACNPPDLIWIVGGFFKLFFGTKFVFDHHDICPELFVAKYGRRGILYRLMILMERCSFRLADVSIATNDSYRKIAIERGGMHPDSVFVVRSGPRIDRLIIKPPVEELKMGRRFLVGYVGVMGPQDGVHLLLAAAHHIVRVIGRKDIHFGLVGNGTEMPRLRRLSKDYDIEAFVTFTGRISDNEMLNMLNTAEVCVNPDVYNEMNDKSTMNKIMEYMCLAKPIVQFDLTEGRVSAGEASLYARPNDAVDMAEKIVLLLDSPALREKMGKEGRSRIVNKLEWSHEVPKLIRAYETACSNGCAFPVAK